MAVAVEMNCRGATIERYDEILGKMGLTPGGSTPPGAISHWVAKTDEGMRVVDVWETREAYDQYAAALPSAATRPDSARRLGRVVSEFVRDLRSRSG